MPRLSPREKDRAKFHLGYATYSGIPAQDVGQLEEALNEVWSATIYREYLIPILDRCDKAWEKTNQAEEPGGEKSLFLGDINRANVKWELGSDLRRWNQYYLRCCEDLALTLHVWNYRNEHTRAKRFDRWGSEYINAVPGPADTSISDHVVLGDLLSSGFGW